MIYLPCEEYVKVMLPALRAALALILINDFKLSLYKAAKLLGVTPATITNYLQGRRGKRTLIEKFLTEPTSKRLLQDIARKIYMQQKISQFDYCNLCIALRSVMRSK